MRAACVLLLLAVAPALAQEPVPPPPVPAQAQPGFLGVAMAPEPLPGVEPAAAAVKVTGIVPGSAAGAGR